MLHALFFNIEKCLSVANLAILQEFVLKHVCSAKINFNLCSQTDSTVLAISSDRFIINLFD